MATQFTLTGKFVAGDNAPGMGAVQVSWRYPYRATGVILGTDVREKTLDGTGSFSITVPLPSGLQADPVLRVDYLPKTGLADIRYYPIPRSTSGTVDLSSLTATDLPDGWLVNVGDLIQGDDGVGVSSLATTNGRLIVTLTDGRTVDAGPLPASTVPGPPGSAGAAGTKGDKGDPGVQGPPGAGSPDATTTAKGSAVILGGTADDPTVPWDKVTGKPASFGGLLDQGFLDAKAYGALGDYVVSTGAGTDDTSAIQAALDACAPGQAHAGKMVLLPAGRYKITAPLVVKAGSGLAGPFRVKGGTKGGQGLTNQTTIYFAGSGTAHAITATDNASKLRLQDFKLCDVRVSPTSGDGIRLQHVFNDIQLQGVEVDWTKSTAAAPFTGSCIWIGGNGTAGTTSDCINIEDIWVLNGLYGIFIENTDNTVLLRNIKCDTYPDQVQTAVIRTGSLGACHIDGVKHENQNADTATVIVENVGVYQTITSVVSRLGNGGPVVRINHTGSGVVIHGLARQNSGPLVQTYQSGTLDKTVTGIRLGSWQGGYDGYFVNEGGFFGDGQAGATSRGRIMTLGRLLVSTFANIGTGVTRTAKLFVKPEVVTDTSLAVTNVASQTGYKVDVYNNSDGSSDFTVDSAGDTFVRRNAKLGGASSTVGFFGSTGIAKPEVTGGRADGAALADLLADLASLGLITNSSTAGTPPATYSDEQAQDAALGNIFLGSGLTGGYSDTNNRYDIAVAAGAGTMVESSLGSWMYPSQQGFKAWNVPAILAAGIPVSITAGYSFFYRLVSPGALSLANLHLYVAAAGAGLSNCYLGLYDANGNQLSVSPDLSTAMQTMGLLTGALAATQAAALAQAVYVGILIGAASTSPTFARINSAILNMAVINQSASVANHGRIGSGGATALPASFSPAALSPAVAHPLWVAAS